MEFLFAMFGLEIEPFAFPAQIRERKAAG